MKLFRLKKYAFEWYSDFFLLYILNPQFINTHLRNWDLFNYLCSNMHFSVKENKTRKLSEPFKLCIARYYLCFFIFCVVLFFVTDRVPPNYNANLRLLYLTGRNGCVWKRLPECEALLQLCDIAGLCFHHQKRFPRPSDLLPPANIFLSTNSHALNSYKVVYPWHCLSQDMKSQY